MLKFKNAITFLSTLFALLFTTVVATPYQQSEALKSGVFKKYVSYDTVVLCDGQIFVVEDDIPQPIDSLHQDENGLYFLAWIYGVCPNGHPYNGDGGCFGPDCPCRH